MHLLAKVFGFFHWVGIGYYLVKLTRKQMPSDKLWTATDEEDPLSSWMALPGGRNLGVGRRSWDGSRPQCTGSSFTT
jgi:hypothetical protein